jgi:6-phosphogluconolactonase
VGIRTILKSGLLWAVPVIALTTLPVQPGRAQGNAGAVYVMTNQSGQPGNSVIVFNRNAAGMLTPAGTFATGGNGMGTGADPLGSQGALVLNTDQRLLLAVNAGSNSVSVLAVLDDGLKLLNTAPSGGVMPVSVTVKKDLVYVLNAGGTPNISGFRIDPETNRLVPLARSTQNLPGSTVATPAQISFTPDGSALVVTEKGTNNIDTFTLEHGIPNPGVSFPSGALTPFGFAFSHNEVLVVSDAFGGADGASAVSSYNIDEDGKVAPITPPLADTQTSACWLVVTRNGRFAYTANATSGTISSYSVSERGTLTLLKAVAGSTGDGSAPTDMDLSGNGRFLYVRNGGNGTVRGFRLEADGSLTSIATVTGVPAGSQGIAAQ